MFVIGQKLAGMEDVSLFSSPWVSAWGATNRYLRRVDPAARGALAQTALRQTGALSMAAAIIHLSDPAAQRPGSGRVFDPALDVPAVDAMKAEWLQITRDRAADGHALLSDPDLVNLLYRWRDYTGAFDEPRAWVTTATRTDAGFASLVTRLMRTVTSHTWGDHVSTSQIPSIRVRSRTSLASTWRGAEAKRLTRRGSPNMRSPCEPCEAQSKNGSGARLSRRPSREWTKHDEPAYRHRSAPADL